jgi:hypothetical protein
VHMGYASFSLLKYIHNWIDAPVVLVEPEEVAIDSSITGAIEVSI